MPGRVGATDHAADGGAHHHVGPDAVGDQRLQDADMGKPAGGAAAQRNTDDRLADAAEPDLAAVIIVRGRASVQEIQHLKLHDRFRAERP